MLRMFAYQALPHVPAAGRITQTALGSLLTQLHARPQDCFNRHALHVRLNRRRGKEVSKPPPDLRQPPFLPVTPLGWPGLRPNGKYRVPARTPRPRAF